jgi:integrase
MAHKRGHYGSGSIDPSGKNSWRLRYRVGAERFAKTVKGSRTEAARELRRLLHSGDTGSHVAPDKITLSQWIDRWLALKEPNVKAQTYERYEIFLKRHVAPAPLGSRRLQKITPTEIDDLYKDLAERQAPRTLAALHVVLKSCLATAVKKKLRQDNPVDDAERPEVDNAETIGATLDEAELMQLIRDFRGTSLHGFVAVACLTGMRRNEILALRWIDVNFDTATITVMRSVEETKKHGRRVMTPKTENSVRTFKIDEGLVALLRSEREKHLRLVAGIPDGVEVDLSLVRLPAEALVFPAVGTDLTAIRSPISMSRMFDKRVSKIGGYPEALRLHDLRGSHETALLDRGVGLHVVAARCGHSPAMLLKSYAKRTKKSDDAAANVLGTMTAGGL